MQIKLTEPQEEFVFSPAPYPAMIAGLGAGKTYAATIRAILKCLSDPGISVGYYLPTYDLIKLRAMPGIEETLSNLGIQYKTNRSEYTVSFMGGGIILRSYDRPERIIAYEVAHSIADEIDTLSAEKAAYVWRKISERNRQKCKTRNSIGCVTTPDQGLAGFVYRTWGKTTNPDYHLIQASTYSNVTLPESYIEQIRQNYDPILAELYLNGEFVSLNQNKVYHQFDRKKHHTDRVIKPGERLHIGLDFNIGGTCAVVCVIENNKPVAVDEFVSHDTQDFINRLARFDGHNLTVYPDATGDASRTNASLSDIALIRQAGYSVDAPKMNPAVRDRVNAVNGLFGHDRMMVNTDKCPELTNALETQGYVKGEPEKFEVHPAIDDWNDAMGYFINRKFPIRKPVLITGIGSARQS